MTEYITMQKAAQIVGKTQQSLYQASWRKVLKTKKYLGRIHTTLAWLREYESALHSRQEHSTFNGKKLFNPEKGQYSVKQAAKFLGVSFETIYYYMSLGRIKGIRRGMYWMIPADQLQEVKRILQEYCA